MDTVAPESVGFSSDRLERLDTVIQRYVDQHAVPGVVMLVARCGQVAYNKSFGSVDVEKGNTPQIDTLYRIYSMTKPITSVAVMMLHEEGRFFLDDPVAEYLPEFKDTKVYAEGGDLVKQKSPMTIRHLLTHTAGLSYGWEDTPVDAAYREVNALDGSLPLHQWTKKVAALPLMAQPGSIWHYSIAVDVLGALVEVVSGQRFGEFLSERIFEPLGMVDTGFHAPAEKAARLSPLYGEGLWVIGPEIMGDYTQPAVWESGGGGLAGTAADYLRFCLMLRNGGTLDGERLLGRKTVAYMASDHLLPGTDRSQRDPGFGFGLGFTVLVDPIAAGKLSSLGEYGWGGLASTHFWLDPLEDIIAIKMTQIIHKDRQMVDVPHRNMDMDLHTAVYQALVD